VYVGVIGNNDLPADGVCRLKMAWQELPLRDNGTVLTRPCASKILTGRGLCRAIGIGNLVMYVSKNYRWLMQSVEVKFTQEQAMKA
jgi:hypothetical protein